MGLKVTSWIKSKNNEPVAVCQSNDILVMSIKKSRFQKLVSIDDVHVSSCLKCFERGYECLDCKLLEDTNIIKWSEYKKTINFLYHNFSVMKNISRNVISCGNTLEELALNVVVDKVSNQKIQAGNLPYALVEKIMSQKEYWIVFGAMFSLELIKLENVFIISTRTIEKCSRYAYVEDNILWFYRFIESIVSCLHRDFPWFNIEMKVESASEIF